jgi:three-Cys-motif partner protein
MKTVDIFFNFMIMDANMNVLLKDPAKTNDRQAERMDFAWGDRSWRDIAYTKTLNLFGDVDETKVSNEAVAEAFRKRLKDVAGFQYVPEPMPMCNENGAVVYYLYFASQNRNGANIVRDIFNTYRSKGMR